MKRRSFIKSALGVSAVIGTVPLCASSAIPTGKAQEYYELRAYRLKQGASADLLHQFLEKGAIPALNKLGAKPVGAFTEIESKDPATVFLLVTYPDLSVFARAADMLKGANAPEGVNDYLQAGKDKPAFDRIDSWLMRAFAGMPQIELADYSKQKSDRIFELRTYESHSELKAARKVDMFNDGEIQLMRDVGLGPVFYGEALTGPNLPHLTYMLSAKNEEEHKAHWAAFGKSPIWAKMNKDPKYADTVSKITKWMLKPTKYSQV